MTQYCPREALTGRGYWGTLGKCLLSLKNVRKVTWCLDIRSGNNKVKARDCEQVKLVGFSFGGDRELAQGLASHKVDRQGKRMNYEEMEAS